MTFSGGRFAPCGRSMIAPTMGDEFCAQTEAPTHKADSRGRLSLQKNKLRAARRARDEIQVLLYALGGEKSPIGGICSPSVAPHLHRRLVREVRSEFLWAVASACKRSTCKVVTLTYTSVCSSCNFSFKQRKVNNPPERGNGFRARTGVSC